MKAKIDTGLRIFLGLIMILFGLNGFLQFMPLPPNPEAADNYMMALVNTGFMMPLVKGLEITAGLMLIANFRTRAALVILAPIMLNAFLFHAFLAPEGVGGALVVLLLIIYFIGRDWNNFKILVAK